MPEGRFLSTEEVAERLQVDEQTVRRWIKSGKLEAVKPGREWRIPPAAFEALLETYSSPKDQAPLQLELEEQRGADEVRRYLSAIFDPYTKELRHISDSYGPRLRLLPPDPHPDDLSRFSWIREFRISCMSLWRMTNNRSFSAVAGPWLSRMNDKTVPADIRQKLRDFEAASTELFDEVEPIAEEWIAAQRDRLPDEWLAKWNAEFEHSLKERAALEKDV